MPRICSKHKDHNPDCRLCNMAKWVNVGTSGHCDHGGEPSQDDRQELTDRDISIHLAYDYLSLIDEAECSLEAWNRICNAKELLDDH